MREVRVVILCMLVLGVVSTCTTLADTQAESITSTPSLVLLRYEIEIPKYRDSTAEDADSTTNAVVDTYSRITQELIKQLRDDSMPNMGKVKIIYLLGELRALRATTLLIENINLKADRVDPKTRIGRWSPYPARDALAKIGPYASHMMLKMIGSHKFDPNKIDGYAEVLVDIETHRYALMKLEDHLNKTEDDTVRKQYQAVIDRVRKIQAGLATIPDSSKSRVGNGPKVDVDFAARTLIDIVRETTDADAKWRSIRALGALQYKEASPLFIECLNNDHPYVRSNAARQLGDMRIKTASAHLIRLLESEENSGVIEQTALALQLLGAREAIPTLKQVSDHNSVQTRMWVLGAIGQLGSRDDVPFLAERLNSSQLLEQHAAAQGIEKLADVDFGFPKRSGPYNPEPALNRARTWWEENKTNFVSE